jgi:hypothetical protein
VVTIPLASGRGEDEKGERQKPTLGPAGREVQMCTGIKPWTGLAGTMTTRGCGRGRLAGNGEGGKGVDWRGERLRETLDGERRTRE